MAITQVLWKHFILILSLSFSSDLSGSSDDGWKPECSDIGVVICVGASVVIFPSHSLCGGRLSHIGKVVFLDIYNKVWMSIGFANAALSVARDRIKFIRLCPSATTKTSFT